MPGWSDILKELQALPERTPSGSRYDVVLRKYLAQLHAYTQRNTILYATRFTQGIPAGQGLESHLGINHDDMVGFMETVQGLTGDQLDIILHSPGGSAEATDLIVKYLRAKFAHVRVIVPHLAQSAATIWACAADVVVMGKHSALGPIDPQMFLQTALGLRLVPAQSILEQFEKARADCANPNNLRIWAPMLPQYGPDLLISSENATALSNRLALTWLRDYMFKGKADAKERAEKLSGWLSTHKEHLTHGRPLHRDELQQRGMNVELLESDQNLQNLVLSVFHAASHLFNGSATLKLIVNHNGKTFARAFQAGPVPPAVPPNNAPPTKKPPVGLLQRFGLWLRSIFSSPKSG